MVGGQGRFWGLDGSLSRETSHDSSFLEEWLECFGHRSCPVGR